MIDSVFAQQVLANLAYWLEQTADLDDARILQLDADRSGLVTAIQFGSRLPQGLKQTANLMWQSRIFVHRRGHSNEWLPLVNVLIEKSFDLEYIRLIMLKGLLHFNIGELSAAISTLVKIFKLENVPHFEQVYTRILLADVYIMRNNYDDARREVTIVQNLLQRAPTVPLYLHANTFNLLTRIAMLTGDYNEAISAGKKEVTIYRKLDGGTALSHSIINLGVAYKRAGKYAEALTCYEEADQILSGTSSRTSKMSVKINMANLFYHLEEWERALEILSTVNSPQLLLHADLPRKANVAHTMGDVTLKLKKYNEAEAYFRQAITQWGGMDRKALQGMAVGGLCEVLLNLGRREEAEAAYVEAVALLEQAPEDVEGQTKLAEINELMKK